MTPIDQAIIMIKDIEQELMGSTKYLQAQDSVFSLPYAVNHLVTARHMLERIWRQEDAATEKLFDIEQDISDFGEVGES